MAFNGSLSYPDGGGRGLCFGRLPFIGILLRRSVLPQASAVHAPPPGAGRAPVRVYPSIPTFGGE